MNLLSIRPFAARACAVLAAGIALSACDSRPMQISHSYNPAAPENAGYTPRRGPNTGMAYPAAPDEVMLRQALARNPSRADIAHLNLKTLGRPLTAQEIADVSVVIAREACGFSENQRMSPNDNCVPAN